MSRKRFQEGEPKAQSLVKNTIVQKYFGAWASVMKNQTTGQICYVDLYAGEGVWDDGTPSNPLLVLEAAIHDPELRARLVTVFSDEDYDVAKALGENIAALPDVGLLHHAPLVLNHQVGADDALLLAHVPDVPALCLLDPEGYAGLSLDLISALASGFGRECIVFFNMNRIRAAIENEGVAGHMRLLFGDDRFRELRARVESLEGMEAEVAILESMADALRERGIRFVLPFRFRDRRGTRTSHHIIHACRHEKGYEIMKEVMAAESSSDSQGVASFEYNVVDERYPILFEYARPLDDLRDMLLERFAGQALTMDQVYRRHNVGTRFIRRNYKAVLLEMEKGGLITAAPPADKRRAGTFADHVTVTFPPREDG